MNNEFHFQSASVDNKHAVLKWDQKNVSYTVKDLNTVNGVSWRGKLMRLFSPFSQTYVNNRPLRGTLVLLKHNDAIRFGYGEQIFEPLIPQLF